MKKPSHPRAQCRYCGFDPDDPKVWAWWMGLSGEDRSELVRLSVGHLQAEVNFTDCGVETEKIDALAASNPILRKHRRDGRATGND